MMGRSSSLFGIDVSRHQGKINWCAVRSAGVKYVFMKATEGATWVDPKFATNWREAKSHGIVRGAYHFFRPHSPVERQVANMVNTVGSLEKGDLPPVLDIEVPEKWRRFSRRKKIELCTSWLDGVEEGLGIRPIVYLSPSFAEHTLENPVELVDYRLWLAHYTKASKPRVPSPWTDYTFWQYSETGRVDGIDTPVDMNRFKGSMDDLLALTVGG